MDPLSKSQLLYQLSYAPANCGPRGPGAGAGWLYQSTPRLSIDGRLSDHRKPNADHWLASSQQTARTLDHCGPVSDEILIVRATRRHTRVRISANL